MSSSTIVKILSLVISASVIVQTTMAGDPDIPSDFIAPDGFPIDGKYFTYTGMRAFVQQSAPPSYFTYLRASKEEFAALDGLSVATIILGFRPGDVSPPHIHPRASELLFVVEGSLVVGFVDTNNKLFTQKLQTGDMFVFPKGLIHFQLNEDPKNHAISVSSLGSASPGLILVPNNLFNTSATIDDRVLSLSFKTNVFTIQVLKKALSTPYN
ncbi:germin-like protein 9-3 [Arachis duranensis]|uniref:Germin-like protein n=1 Tax=Arachis duranensis TaxID=130453 RepID=A0A6P4B935_ARADU|nr:germin-like protein 9-3 [Arachis duranensis]XP_052112469.1 germin-like protein 9-3 [Arachis duranensis]